jgi:hypothetical protein
MECVRPAWTDRYGLGLHRPDEGRSDPKASPVRDRERGGVQDGRQLRLRAALSLATAAYDAVAQPSLGQNSGSSSMGRSSGSTWKRRRISSRGSLARAR